jgi:enoyl-[acyl-carrier protein] reductase II
MKSLVAVRLLRNEFFRQVHEMERSGASAEALQELLGKGRAKLGMFEGNLTDGELEIGQASALIAEILPAGKIVEEIVSEWKSITG